MWCHGAINSRCIGQIQHFCLGTLQAAQMRGYISIYCWLEALMWAAMAPSPADALVLQPVHSCYINYWYIQATCSVFACRHSAQIGHTDDGLKAETRS